LPVTKGGTATTVRKGIPHTDVHLPTLISEEATGDCIPIGNNEVLMQLLISPGHAWADTGITELLNLEISPYWHMT
jgi:hypothetical protein